MARHNRNKIQPTDKNKLKVKTVVVINSVCILALSIVMLLHLMGAI